MRLLLLLVSHVTVVTAVDRCHGDRDKDHRLRENCTGAGFRDVPGGFDPKTKVLLFPRNRFTSLSWSSFQTFTEIYEVDLSGNEVPEVTPSPAPILPSLSVLRLGSNLLTSLPDGSFSACPALSKLYLDNNSLRSLRDHTFAGLSKLEILDLSSNHIRVLPGLLLHPLPALETLYLENNKIQVMPDGWFSKKEEVPYLYLSANPWTCNCSLSYLHRYLNEYEFNVYVRDGDNISGDAESVVCESPQLHEGKAVMSLEESDLCPKETSTVTETWSQTGAIVSLSRGDGSRSSDAAATDPTGTSGTQRPAASTFSPAEPEASAATTKLWGTTASSSMTETSTIAEAYSTEASTPIITESSTIAEASSTQASTIAGAYSTEASTPIITEASTPITQASTITEASSTEASTIAGAYSTQASSTETSTPIITESSTTESSTPITEASTSKASTPGGPSLAGVVTADRWARTRADRAAVFCFWLLVVCLLLCVASAACVTATGVWLLLWYRRVYRPWRRGGGQPVTLSTLDRAEEEAAKARYRSVLYVHREEQEADGGKDGGSIDPEPTAAGGREERRVYRKTLYRLISKEEAIEGWRDVMEDCRVSAGRTGGGEGGARGGGASQRRYRVILREEREEAGGGREELDWVVGGWEVKEEEPSWGAWLAGFLPSMPWAEATPPGASL